MGLEAAADASEVGPDGPPRVLEAVALDAARVVERLPARLDRPPGLQPVEVRQEVCHLPGPDEGLRGFFWYSPVQKVKSGAQVLLHHPTDTNVQTGEPNPLLVLGYFPAGRTMYLAVDSTYRWRYHYGDRYLDTFWRNAIRWLALGRLKSGDRRFRIETSRSTYDLEDRVLVESRILDEDFRPSEQPTQKVFWSGPEVALVGLGLIALGVPVYMLYRAGSREKGVGSRE